MKRDESFYLHHILDAIGKADECLQGLDEGAFSRTTLVQDGVIRQIEIIGEATNDCPSNFGVGMITFTGRTLPECGTN
jgi:uncharacterized protein with HEPN domain